MKTEYSFDNETWYDAPEGKAFVPGVGEIYLRMTNETTASQPKPPSGNRCPCDSSGTCQDVCPDPATGLPLCASADCYSARKPKSRSIGNDAQFWELMKEVIESLHSDALYRQARTALVAYIDSRVPAAQASATIQAAPLPAERTPNSSDPRDEAHAAGWNACLAAIRSVATIQEPVMVAEPFDREEFIRQVSVSVAEMDRDSPEGQPEMMLVTPDELQNTMRSVFERFDDAAPMVADPAGVVLLDSRFLHSKEIASDEPIVDSTRLSFWRQGWNAYRNALAATVKAVPSEALDAARYRWLRDKSEPGICAFYLSVGKAFDGVKFTQTTVDEAIDAQIAAPLADKTGGGE